MASTKAKAPIAAVVVPAASFPREGLQFLKSLARHNDRAWFEPRRSVYEQSVKAPMLAIIARAMEAMMDFAPAHVRPPEKCLMRIYRDIRFSSDKRPYKSHVAAWWTRDGLPKTSGAGYYLHISGKEVIIAAGAYMPPKEQLLAIRHSLLEHHEAYRRILADKAVRKLFSPDTGAPLSRVPKGFCKDHPAEDLVRQRHWGLTATLPTDAALANGFAETVIRHFRAAHPLVDFLNAPLLPALARKRKPLFGFR